MSPQQSGVCALQYGVHEIHHPLEVLERLFTVVAPHFLNPSLIKPMTRWDPGSQKRDIVRRKSFTASITTATDPDKVTRAASGKSRVRVEYEFIVFDFQFWTRRNVISFDMTLGVGRWVVTTSSLQACSMLVV